MADRNPSPGRSSEVGCTGSRGGTPQSATERGADIPGPQEGSILALGDKYGRDISYIVLKSGDQEYAVGQRGYIKEATFSENGTFTKDRVENGIFIKDNLLVYSKAGLLADKAAPKLKELVLEAHVVNIPWFASQGTSGSFHISESPLLPVQADEAIRAMSYGYSYHHCRLMASGAISFMFPCSGLEPGLLQLKDTFDLAANMIQVPLKALLEQEHLTEAREVKEIHYATVCSIIWVMAMSNGRSLDEGENSEDSHSCRQAEKTIRRRLSAHGLHGGAWMPDHLAKRLQEVFGDWYDDNPQAGRLLSLRAIDGQMMMANRFKFLDPFFCEIFFESLSRQRQSRRYPTPERHHEHESSSGSRGSED